MRRSTLAKVLFSLAALSAAAALAGCGGGGGGDDVPACTGPACPDAVTDPGPLDDGPADLGPQDRGPADEGTTPFDPGGDVDECQCAGGEKPWGFGCVCERMADCISGFCVLMPDDTRQCTQTCIENCPCGWECQQVYLGGEPISVCVPYQDPLCNKECVDDGVCGIDALCVQFESKKYCLQSCGEGQPCPSADYECKEVTNAAGDQTSQQCVPVSGHCDCAPDVDYLNDVDHCGTCETQCAFPNGVPFCDQGDCALAGCLEGYMNLNQGQPGGEEDGCEYKCTFKGNDDRPDPDSVGEACPGENCYDENCDGLDGVIARGVFVDTATGDDADNTFGDQAHPFKTIGAAVAFAKGLKDLDPGSKRTDVYVSKGQYREQVILADGISLFGGYDAAVGWRRDIDQNKTQIFWDGQEAAAVRSVVAVNIIGDTWFDGFIVKTSSATQSGSSSYGMYVYHCSGGLKIRNNQIEAGNGADGRAGLAGLQGQNATNGGNGTGSFEYGNCGLGLGCNSGAYPGDAVPGNGGSSPCGNGGGKGGRGGGHDSNGYAGEAGANGGGAAGTLGGGQQDGGPGGKGTKGTNGDNGNGGAPGGSLNPAGLWIPANGQDGKDGANGKGGGGGGGGGGDSECTLSIGCESAGGSGGGGGGGGCGGTGGKGGSGGGGSFALFVVEASPDIRNNVLSSLSGGNGGPGGTGGEYGLGGSGGAGGGRLDDDAGAGGPGGAGGEGGRGGSGGGGAGGSTFPLYVLGGSSSPTCEGNQYQLNGFRGAGGAGGAGNANKGADGSEGQISGSVPTCLP